MKRHHLEEQEHFPPPPPFGMVSVLCSPCSLPVHQKCAGCQDNSKSVISQHGAQITTKQTDFEIINLPI